MNNSSSCNLDVLQANLLLLATNFTDLQSYLKGYSKAGIYIECIEGVREPMATFSSIILSQTLSVSLIAKIFDCYYLIESLARSPLTNTVEAFKTNEHWLHAKQFAKGVAEDLEKVL